ncbi:UNVERIFIED_CONTAM: hypothetical protein Scaly_0079000 [Sesamum calycinum]|uniref:Uncharacterized protein n=1 Tax=Sesamum calycinum TaxID=2727403 RepID=A0AAW2SUM0_9LAMI
MLYWKDDDLEYCKFCGDGRYKPARGRDPLQKKSPYAILRCMSFEYMFLMMVIPGLSYPKCLIDVYLEPLIEELLQLWHVGVRTYDHATDRAFMIRAALMWTMNDLPVYEMASGWSTVGIMGCPVCMDDTRAFHLQHGITSGQRKASFGISHTGQHFLSDTILMSCTLRKMCLTIYFNTVMDIKEKTADNMNARRDLKIICNRPELELDEHRLNVMPKAVYTLGKEQERRLYE